MKTKTWDYLCHLVIFISMWLISTWSFRSVKRKEASLCTVASLKHDAIFLGGNLAIFIKTLKYELIFILGN